MPCVVHASEHPFSEDVLLMDVCIDLSGKKLSTRLLLAVGVCSLNEWKCICVTSLENVPGVAIHLRSEGHSCNPGSLVLGSLESLPEPSILCWKPPSRLRRTRVKSSMLPGRKSCGVTQMHAGSVRPRGEPHGVPVTAHWKWSAFSSKEELQQEAAGKAEEPSANSRTAAPRGPPRRPGGEHHPPLPRQRAAEPLSEARDQRLRAQACRLFSNLKQIEGSSSPRLGALFGELVSKWNSPREAPCGDWPGSEVPLRHLEKGQMDQRQWNKPILNVSSYTVNFLPVPLIALPFTLFSTGVMKSRAFLIETGNR